MIQMGVVSTPSRRQAFRNRELNSAKSIGGVVAVAGAAAGAEFELSKIVVSHSAVVGGLGY
jgi:hypothetical protein